MTAEAVLSALRAQADPEDTAYVARFYAGDLPSNRVMGTRMPKVFPIARAHVDLRPGEVRRLLDDPHYEARMAAVSILDIRARARRLEPEDRRELLDIYLGGLERQIDTWDLVVRAAAHVVGEAVIALGETSLLDRLAVHPRPMARRTAVVATHAHVKRDDTGPTFRIARLLAGDAHPFVQKAIGSWIREAGKRDPGGLAAFLAEMSGILPAATAKAAAKP